MIVTSCLKSVALTNLYSSDHFRTPRVHSLFPFWETFGYNRLWVQLLVIKCTSTAVIKMECVVWKEENELCNTWNRVVDGRGPTLHMYRHLGSGPVGVNGRHSFGNEFNFFCISSSTKLRGTSTPSGVTPTCYIFNHTTIVQTPFRPKFKTKTP